MSRPFHEYDQRGYRTVDVRSGYAIWAETYDRSMDDTFDLPLLEAVASSGLNGAETALDLACGTGRLGVWLKRRGVRHVDGIDATEAMLERAMSKEVYDFLAKADLAALPAWLRGYDLAVCGLAACHVPCLASLYSGAASAVRPGGHFALVDYHPFFLLNGIPTHFRGPDEQPLAIDNHVHLFSDHVAAAQAARWQLKDLRERLVDEPWVARVPSMGRFLGQPISFVTVWEKSG
jgi:SAM-dependent methyltransferase